MISFFLKRPAFFSTYEWWYHLLLMPVLFPLGNYYFIGARYFNEPLVFAVGTSIIFGLYWLSVIVLTVAVRWVIARFPDVRQALPRTLTMLLLVGALTIVLAIFDVWIYSIFPLTGVTFNWDAVRPIWVLGLLFDLFLCIALSMFYTYAQWKNHVTENEQLKRMALQHQFDRLKGQLNPHFLFNSLNSLSSLISEDPAKAERFVDDLAKVYRYMLQAGKNPIGGNELVTLQAEMDFVAVYINLLRIRYGDNLQVEQRIDALFLNYQLPPLSVQILIDNAIKHNIMLSDKPLTISIHTTAFGQLRIENNLQRKNLRVETRQSELSNLTAKYQLLTEEPVAIQETSARFVITLPLFHTPPAKRL
ncbi:sensor histidine kinase [Spirosoma profusum]|uniref:sensor histidine kinase n=1 Tax=Spirosoma profusum TaxID=2771354 RepID=UPI001CC267BF|nr:histidine kinase [Spirosoma profusum]